MPIYNHIISYTYYIYILHHKLCHILWKLTSNLAMDRKIATSFICSSVNLIVADGGFASLTVRYSRSPARKRSMEDLTVALTLHMK